MKQYKLIDTYPGSPEIGDIAYKRNNCEYYYVNGKGSFAYKNVENQPRFWQEVKEYPKIVAFKNKRYPDLIFRLNHPLSKGNDWYCQENTWLSFKDDENIIWEVAKSETEVFTIGDRVKHVNENGNPYIITKFELYNGLILARDNTKSHINQVTDIIKVNTPLFTTEDGKEIYSGDKFWRIKDFKIEFYHADECWIPKKDELVFSKVETADKWIDENKPVFSKKEINEIILSLVKFTIRPGYWVINATEFKEKLGI